ncbi:uncharacterized protein PGTG_01197 [Puccinia graminis f. sp. tritici CRL 75-36-700-3]|uniref:No apical meristem-associated C-terminal domain-containing protein n=1 Tax=Puccinia graminis f. sp. tritici (strain CRL 75-36-700-3 / race SCCL) TaxID=418459 RepID=E3JUZ1_PUCGT|nr:uncharacterized protein PGTG_01197 [Puccinia graminis f. sp. tritici CRL 75-36-700-3]EFP75866.1 hypothetical protein PGTG_01197 [Puccinia graminis f. sp. tritici CRL 75-36-700-3]
MTEIDSDGVEQERKKKDRSKKRARSPSSNVPQSLPTSEPAGTADEGLVSTTTPADSESTDRPMCKKKAKALHRSKVDGSEDWKDKVAIAQKEIAAQAKRQNEYCGRPRPNQ